MIFAGLEGVEEVSMPPPTYARMRACMRDTNLIYPSKSFRPSIFFKANRSNWLIYKGKILS